MKQFQDQQNVFSFTDLLPEVHGEAHVPNVTLAVVKAAQDGHVGLVGFDVVDVVLHLPWFPADDGIFTGLQQRNTFLNYFCTFS